jgi:hypothetical protein
MPDFPLPFWQQVILVFLLMTALDYFWAKYTAAIAGKHPLWAGFHAMIILFFNGAVTIAYVADTWMLLPALVGAFLGTYLAVKSSARKGR